MSHAYVSLFVADDFKPFLGKRVTVTYTNRYGLSRKLTGDLLRIGAVGITIANRVYAERRIHFNAIDAIERAN